MKKALGGISTTGLVFKYGEIKWSYSSKSKEMNLYVIYNEVRFVGYVQEA